MGRNELGGKKDITEKVLSFDMLLKSVKVLARLGYLNYCKEISKSIDWDSEFYILT